MAKTKISTIAKELNVALPTVYSFLSEKGISIEASPIKTSRTSPTNLLRTAAALPPPLPKKQPPKPSPRCRPTIRLCKARAS